MWNDSDERQHPEALYHALASLSVAGITLLMAVPALTLAFLLGMTEFQGWGRDDKRLAAYGGYVGAGIVVLLCLVGMVIGFRGIGAGGRTGEPRILCGVGIALCLFSAAIWVMAGFAWHLLVGQFIP